MQPSLATPPTATLPRTAILQQSAPLDPTTTARPDSAAELRHAALIRHVRRYRLVLAVWTAVFLFTGCLFVLAPAHVVALLAGLGNLLGLRGELDVQPGTLWHVLAVSLMVAVTGLSWANWRRPYDDVLWRLLLAAKVASTIGFLVLVGTRGSMWLTSAGADGFVAVSLVLARRGVARSLRATLPGWRRRHAGLGPAYEVWFGKVELAPDQAFWFRYTLLDGVTREAAAWAIVFDAGRTVTGRTRWPLEAVAVPADGQIAPDDAVFQIDGARLDATGATGTAGPVSWNLRWTDRGLRFQHVPAALRMLGLASSELTTPLADLRVSGTVRCGDRTFTVRDATGMVGHIHGRRHAHAWVWAHCNHFDGGEDAVFEGLAAQLQVAGRVLPPATSFALALDGHTWQFTSTWRMFAADSETVDGTWRFAVRSGGAVLTGEVVAPSANRVALVEYTDTDDRKLYCANSKLSTLRLHLVDPSRGVDRRLVATATAAFEQVDRAPPSRPVDL